MVGGYDFIPKKSEYNRVLQGTRQPGSSFKPFVYAAALDKGFNPASIIVDSPIIFENQGQNENLKWIPENNSEQFYGDTTLRTALIKSRNVPTVKLLQEIQIPYFIDYLKNLAVTDGLNPDLSLALGSNAISLMHLTKTYAIFPRNGIRIEPVYVLKITDRSGEVVYEHSADDLAAQVAERWLEIRTQIDESDMQYKEAQEELKQQLSEQGDSPEIQAQLARLKEEDERRRALRAPRFDDPLRAMDAKTAFIMNHLLQQVVTSGTGVRAARLHRRVGGKTGTTNDFVDAWFVGFSPEVVTGVWTGFDTPRTMGKSETGSRASLPAWINYMQAALRVYPRDEYQVPKGIVFVRINPDDGTLADAKNPRAVKVAFVEGTEPTAQKRPNTQVPDSSDFFKEDF